MITHKELNVFTIDKMMQLYFQLINYSNVLSNTRAITLFCLIHKEKLADSKT